MTRRIHFALLLTLISPIALASAPRKDPPPPPWEPDGKKPPHHEFQASFAACKEEAPPSAANLDKVAWNLPMATAKMACNQKDVDEAARRYAFDACCSLSAKKDGRKDPGGVKEARATSLQTLGPGSRAVGQAAVVCGDGSYYRILIFMGEHNGECHECGTRTSRYGAERPDWKAAEKNTHIVRMEDGPRTSPHGVNHYCRGTYWPKQ